MEQGHIDKFNLLNGAGKSLKQDTAKKRGEEFETLINDVLESENILLQRSYRINEGVREQIDGAIKVDSRVILVEVKWVESGIAASVLYSFMGKVDNKFDGTIGLFLSREELSESVLLALNKGRRQRILVIHGEDLDLIFKNGVLFEDYLIEAIHEMSIRNDSHLPVKKYLSRLHSQPKIQQAKSRVDETVSNFVTDVLINPGTTSIMVSVRYQLLNADERKSLFEFVVRQFPQFYEFRIKRDGQLQLPVPNIVKNVTDLLELYIDDDTVKNNVSVELVKAYYSKYIIELPMYYHRSVLPKFFASQYKFLDEPTQKTIENRIVRTLKGISGIYDSENYLTDVIRPLWPYLRQETKKRLKPIYLEYFISSRDKNFPQVAFAIHLLQYEFITKDEINKWLIERITEDQASYKQLGITVSLESNSDRYSSLWRFLDTNEGNWYEYVRALFGK